MSRTREKYANNREWKKKNIPGRKQQSEGKIKVQQVERDVEKGCDRQVEEVRRSSSASRLKRAGVQIKARED